MGIRISVLAAASSSGWMLPHPGFPKLFSRNLNNNQVNVVMWYLPHDLDGTTVGQ